VSGAGQPEINPMRRPKPNALRALIAGVVGAMSIFGASAASALEFAKHVTDGDNIPTATTSMPSSCAAR
jgi:hypothetical protein